MVKRGEGKKRIMREKIKFFGLAVKEKKIFFFF
jgi:hypothetical protein